MSPVVAGVVFVVAAAFLAVQGLADHIAARVPAAAAAAAAFLEVVFVGSANLLFFKSSSLLQPRRQFKRLGKVTYASGGHLSGSLEKAWLKLNATKKALEKNQEGKRARHSATKEATPNIYGWFLKVLIRVGLSSHEVRRPAGGAVRVRRLTRCSCVQSSKLCSSS
jgi:hypothetical protein